MNKMESTKVKKNQSWVIFLLVVVNVVLFYFLMGKLYFRVDLTEGKKYSVSKPTVELLKKLDNKLVINYYYEKRCKEVPGISQVIQYVDDMLQEYEAHGKGMVDYRKEELSFDNQNHKEKIAEIEKLGVRTVALSQNEATESKSTLGFSGIVFNYKGKNSSIGVIFNDARFEYMVDVEITKLLGNSKERVGLLLSSGNRTLEKDFRYLYQYVTNEYPDAEVIYSLNELSEEISTVLLVGGENLSDYEVYQLDQFMMNGGKLFWLVNGVKLNFENPYGPPATPSSNKVIDMVASYGITVNKDLVGDNLSYNPVAQRGNLFIERMRYPLWIKVVSENINKKSLIVDDFDVVNLFWASSIQVADSLKEKVEPLLKTTKQAWSMADNFKIDVDTYKYPLQEGAQQYLLGCTYAGPLVSYFKEKEIPEPPEGVEERKGKLSEGSGKLIVIANEDFLSNDFLNRDDELLIALNGLDWLTKDGSLIKIRNKGKFTKPLNKVNNLSLFEMYKNLIITFTTILIPVFFLFLAFSINNARKKKYLMIENDFAEIPQAKGSDSGEGEKDGK